MFAVRWLLAAGANAPNRTYWFRSAAPLTKLICVFLNFINGIDNGIVAASNLIKYEKWKVLGPMALSEINYDKLKLYQIHIIRFQMRTSYMAAAVDVFFSFSKLNETHRRVGKRRQTWYRQCYVSLKSESKYVRMWAQLWTETVHLWPQSNYGLVVNLSIWKTPKNLID